MINQLSLDSYHQLTDIGRTQRIVYNTIAQAGPISRRSLAGLLGWPVNRVTGRVTELMEFQLIKVSRLGYDQETNRHVELLEVVR